MTLPKMMSSPFEQYVINLLFYLRYTSELDRSEVFSVKSVLQVSTCCCP
jgi:hypothetical protein